MPHSRANIYLNDNTISIGYVREIYKTNWNTHKNQLVVLINYHKQSQNKSFTTFGIAQYFKIKCAIYGYGQYAVCTRIIDTCQIIVANVLFYISKTLFPFYYYYCCTICATLHKLHLNHFWSTKCPDMFIMIKFNRFIY